MQIPMRLHASLHLPVNVEASMTNWIHVQSERILLSTIAFLISIVISSTSQAAPKELLGKTISNRNSNTQTWETPRGVATAHGSVERLIYVTELGRVFSRGHRARGRDYQTDEQSPDERSEVGDYNFVGDT